MTQERLGIYLIWLWWWSSTPMYVYSFSKFANEHFYTYDILAFVGLKLTDKVALFSGERGCNFWNQRSNRSPSVQEASVGIPVIRQRKFTNIVGKLVGNQIPLNGNNRMYVSRMLRCTWSNVVPEDIMLGQGSLFDVLVHCNHNNFCRILILVKDE